ncbi:MAG: 3-phosphoshikimate 1-carboxyvinyltransferase [Promethearchaeota archaeon]
MDLIINPVTNNLQGEITAPSSKSYSHRAFVAASLADGISIIKNPLTTGDIEITMNILKLLGVKIIKVKDNSYAVKKVSKSLKPIREAIDCRNSGTSIRIFSALSLIIDGGLSLKGEFIKLKRPILPLLKALKNLGGSFKVLENQIQIKREKQICKPIKIRGDISSQFITALLFVCPILKCKRKTYIDIEITTPLVSSPYIQITIDVLNDFGINLQGDIKNRRFSVICGQKYRSQVFTIPGDFSSAAFIIAATVLSRNSSHVIINNLNIQNPQGDKRIIEILKEMGANIKIDKIRNQIIIDGNLKDYPLKGIEIDCQEIPDLFPILSVIGAFATGKTVLFNASKVRLKESDRISIIARELSRMGVKVEEEGDKLIIYHCNNLKGSIIDHEKDHRIAMACVIAALYADSPSEIKNIEIVRDSYPNFINDLKKLGVSFN